QARASHFAQLLSLLGVSAASQAEGREFEPRFPLQRAAARQEHGDCQTEPRSQRRLLQPYAPREVQALQVNASGRASRATTTGTRAAQGDRRDRAQRDSERQTYARQGSRTCCE